MYALLVHCPSCLDLPPLLKLTGICFCGFCSEQAAYLTGRGVPGSGGVDIGKVQLMLKARPLQGMRIDLATGARHKVSIACSRAV